MSRIVTPTRGFYELLAELKSKGARFSAKTLRELPYDQLLLAAMGNAGVCRCSVEDVTQEKQERRALFLGMPQEKFAQMKLEDQLASDIQDDRIACTRAIPSWRDLSVAAKLYFKLTCLEAHPHDAFLRMSEVVALCREASPSLPQQLAFSLKLEFQSAVLSKPSTEWVKEASTKASNLLHGFITGPEIDTVDRLELRDYVCTAGCFYPFSGLGE